MCCLTLLPKLLASSYVVMLGWGEKAAFLCHSRAFAFHKRAYEPVVTASMPQGSLAGRTEDHRLAASLQVEQAVACAVVCLRWHVGVVEDARHHLCEFPGRLSGTLYVLPALSPLYSLELLARCSSTMVYLPLAWSLGCVATSSPST